MKINSLSLLVLAVLFLVFESCTHKEDVPVDKGNSPDTLCDPNLVYFVNDIKPIIISSCAYSGCHDVATHADGVDLTTYDKIIATGEVTAGDPYGSELYEKISEGKMPPSGALPSVQQQKIFDWIKQGAKNNECVHNCDSINVTYTATIEPIISNNCTACHSGSNAGGGIMITNYGELKAIGANGSLLGSIEHSAGFSAMPKGMAKLSDCNISQIKNWINEGMQNN